MNPTPILCPACLTELPDDYPYDHVVIDRVLSNDTDLFTVLSTDERREVFTVGLARGIAITALADRLGVDTRRIRELLPDEHHESVVNASKRRDAERTALDLKVRALWSEGLPDTDISLRTGRSVYVIGGARRRLGLATLPSRRVLLTGGNR